MSILKNRQSRQDLLKKIQEEIKKTTTPTDVDEQDYWRLTKDDAGNGNAIIRFLPGDENDDLPYVKYFRHAFKGPSGKTWYIENSRTTIGEKDPCSDLNTELWNTGIKENQALASDRKRKLTYVSNILVIKDPKRPENEGKVFKFQYGKKIFDKITAMVDPVADPLEEVQKQPVNVFDVIDGANFKLKAKTVEKQLNYDESCFSDPSPIFGGDEKKINELDAQLFSLKKLLAPENFKSYDVLKERLNRVLGNTTVAQHVRTQPRENVNLPQASSEVDGDNVEEYLKTLVGE